MNLPIDWPRINQFPEWFTVESDKEYQLADLTYKTTNKIYGSELINGVDLNLENEKVLIIYK